MEITKLIVINLSGSDLESRIESVIKAEMLKEGYEFLSSHNDDGAFPDIEFRGELIEPKDK